MLAFYDQRRRNLLNAKPNGAHFALARLEGTLAERGGTLTLVTQNIDDLHERAGSTRVTHVHGELLKARCGVCQAVRPWLDDLAVSQACPDCGRAAVLRPHVVWFGEMPLAMDLIDRALRQADLFVAIGLRARFIRRRDLWPRRATMASARARSTLRLLTMLICSTSSAWAQQAKPFRIGSRRWLGRNRVELRGAQR